MTSKSEDRGSWFGSLRPSSPRGSPSPRKSKDRSSTMHLESAVAAWAGGATLSESGSRRSRRSGTYRLFGRGKRKTTTFDDATEGSDDDETSIPTASAVQSAVLQLMASLDEREELLSRSRRRLAQERENLLSRLSTAHQQVAQAEAALQPVQDRWRGAYDAGSTVYLGPDMSAHLVTLLSLQAEEPSTDASHPAPLAPSASPRDATTATAASVPTVLTTPSAAEPLTALSEDAVMDTDAAAGGGDSDSDSVGGAADTGAGTAKAGVASPTATKRRRRFTSLATRRLRSSSSSSSKFSSMVKSSGRKRSISSSMTFLRSPRRGSTRNAAVKLGISPPVSPRRVLERHGDGDGGGGGHVHDGNRGGSDGGGGGGHSDADGRDGGGADGDARCGDPPPAAATQALPAFKPSHAYARDKVAKIGKKVTGLPVPLDQAPDRLFVTQGVLIDVMPPKAKRYGFLFTDVLLLCTMRRPGAYAWASSIPIGKVTHVVNQPDITTGPLAATNAFLIVQLPPDHGDEGESWDLVPAWDTATHTQLGFAAPTAAKKQAWMTAFQSLMEA